MAQSRRIPAMDFMLVTDFRLGHALLINHLDRLGPLSIEQKKRNTGKRAKLEKNKEDERKPQELQDEDIARSENETTKSVKDVGLVQSRYSSGTI